VEGKAARDDYRQSWLDHAKSIKGIEIKEERLSIFTTRAIQAEVQHRFGTRDIDIEKKVGGASQLAFDLWNKTERTAFEICLGAIKNEFEKDILKGILDQDTTRLVIFYREYGHGSRGVVYGKKWFAHPAQKEIMDRARIFKLKVDAIPLIE
jgi:hypothetical protein